MVFGAHRDAGRAVRWAQLSRADLLDSPGLVRPGEVASHFAWRRGRPTSERAGGFGTARAPGGPAAHPPPRSRHLALRQLSGCGAIPRGRTVNGRATVRRFEAALRRWWILKLRRQAQRDAGVRRAQELLEVLDEILLDEPLQWEGPA